MSTLLITCFSNSLTKVEGVEFLRSRPDTWVRPTDVSVTRVRETRQTREKVDSLHPYLSFCESQVPSHCLDTLLLNPSLLPTTPVKLTPTVPSGRGKEGPGRSHPSLVLVQSGATEKVQKERQDVSVICRTFLHYKTQGTRLNLDSYIRLRRSTLS